MADTARAWRVVLEHIEHDLRAGRLGPGDRLPSERELSTALGVGRSSVREALRVLEVMGLIRTATGSGPQAGAIVIAAPTGGLAALLSLQVAAQGFAVGDVVRTRVVLEDAVAQALADDPDRDLSEVHGLLSAMEREGLSATEFLALDARLHLACAEASGNGVIAAMMAGLRSSIESYVLAGADRLPDWGQMSATLMQEHRALVAAIEAGDGGEASRLVRDHILGYYRATGLVTDSAAPTA